MRGGPGVYLPLKGRRPPRGEDSGVPVLEGACLGLNPKRTFLPPSTFKAPGPQSGKWEFDFPWAASDALKIHSSGLERCLRRLPGH